MINPEHFGSGRQSKPALCDEAVDLHRKVRFVQSLFGIWMAEIGVDVSASLIHAVVIHLDLTSFATFEQRSTWMLLHRNLRNRPVHDPVAADHG